MNRLANAFHCTKHSMKKKKNVKVTNIQWSEKWTISLSGPPDHGCMRAAPTQNRIENMTNTNLRQWLVSRVIWLCQLRRFDQGNHYRWDSMRSHWSSPWQTSEIRSCFSTQFFLAVFCLVTFQSFALDKHEKWNLVSFVAVDSCKIEWTITNEKRGTISTEQKKQQLYRFVRSCVCLRRREKDSQKLNWRKETHFRLINTRWSNQSCKESTKRQNFLVEFFFILCIRVRNQNRHIDKNSHFEEFFHRALRKQTNGDIRWDYEFIAIFLEIKLNEVGACVSGSTLALLNSNGVQSKRKQMHFHSTMRREEWPVTSSGV